MVHGNLAAVQRHWAVKHGLSDEQPQRMISKMYEGVRATCTFGDSNTGTREREASSRFQPYRVGSIAGGSASAAAFHMAV